MAYGGAMHGLEKRMLLRHYLEQGLTKKALAEKLGISRDTIHRWIRAGELDRDVDQDAIRYGPRAPMPTKLDPYKETIKTRLDRFPELSAVRLFDEVKAAGYAGGYTQLKEYVRAVRPALEPEAVVRFETPPGKQAQVDFARFRFPWGVRYALLVVLGYSRLLWLRFYERQDMRTLFLGLEEAFHYFGGVPKELLFDQMKSVITKDLRLDGGALMHNAEFLRFAAHWDFTPRACRPYRAQTKGKVERPVRYVRGNFVYGRDFLNDADLDHQRLLWLDGKANVRVHRTIGERPVDRFERDERALLTPLAARPYYSLALEPAQTFVVPVVKTPLVVERRPLTVYDQIAGGGA
jgi:transposase